MNSVLLLIYYLFDEFNKNNIHISSRSLQYAYYCLWNQPSVLFRQSHHNRSPLLSFPSVHSSPWFSSSPRSPSITSSLFSPDSGPTFSTNRSLHRLPTWLTFHRLWHFFYLTDHARFLVLICIKFGERSFSYAGPYAWKSLPQHIREITDTTRFKRHLKTVLFQRAFLDF